MSLFQEISVRCPACYEPVTVDAVNSVNADRRPDLREEILGNDFQLVTCGKCEKTFRLDPDLTYLDVQRGQWLAVHPFGHIGRWEALEAEARRAFDLSYGDKAAASARELGAELSARVVFGWAAVREKIFAREQGLDDVTLELTKMAVLRSGHPAPITSRTELRLVDVADGELVMSWIIAETGAVEQSMGVPKALFDEIATDDNWNELRGELQGKLFVDMQRLMLTPA